MRTVPPNSPPIIAPTRSLSERIKARVGTAKNPKNGNGFKTNKKLEKGSYYTSYSYKGLNQSQKQSQSQNHSAKFSNTPQTVLLNPAKHDALLDEIMSLSQNLPQHKLTFKGGPNLKYEEASSYLRLLQQGKLFIGIAPSKYDLDYGSILNPKWCKKFRIERQHLTWKFTPQSLLSVFRDIAKSYSIGFDPLDKSRLPKSISGIILNSWAGTSMFLKIFVNGVKPVAELINGFNRNQLTEQERNVLDILLNAVKVERTTAIGDGRVAANEEFILRKVAKRIIQEYDERLRLIGDEFHGWPTLLDLVRDYTSWLGQHKGGIGKVQWLGPDGYDWEKFLTSRDITTEMIAAATPRPVERRQR